MTRGVCSVSPTVFSSILSIISASSTRETPPLKEKMRPITMKDVKNLEKYNFQLNLNNLECPK